MKVNKKYSRRFLMSASAYRKACAPVQMDFSATALAEQYRHETHGGVAPDRSKNGYAQGKWMIGVTLKSIREDLREGLFCKADYRNACAFVREFVSKQQSAVFFGWR